MLKVNQPRSPSVLLRKQINNLSQFMQSLAAKTVANMSRLNIIKEKFYSAKTEAYSRCSSIDDNHSIQTQDDAFNATYILMRKLVQLKNEAMALVENEEHPQHLLENFQLSMDYVEQMIKESIQPFVDGTLRHKNVNRQALGILESWSHLYRHGLRASLDIPQRGEKWLSEVNRHIDITSAALQQLQEEAEKEHL